MLPAFHDGLLCGLSVAETTATLSLVEVDGRRWAVELMGVRLLKADDFRQGNIVLDLAVVTGELPPHGWLEKLLPAPDPEVAARYHDAHRSHIEELEAGIAAGALTLVVLSPSYGCELWAICEACRGIELPQPV